MNKAKKRGVVTLATLTAVLLIAVICVFSSMYVVEQNEYAYVTRFSKLVTYEEEPGLYFKAPFIDSVRKIPSYQMLYDIPPSDVLTADKKTLVIDNFVIWSVEDPQLFVQSIRGSISEAESRISAAVYSAVKNEFGRLQRDEIISTDPTSVERVAIRVTDYVNDSLKSYGLGVTSVEIKKTDLPEDNALTVYNRMVAERNQIATEYLAEGNYEAAQVRNEVDARVNVIIAEAQAQAEKRRGEAEAKYMEIMSQAYSDPDRAEFYEFLRGLDALRTSFSNTDTTLILDEDSEIVRILLGK